MSARSLRWSASSRPTSRRSRPTARSSPTSTRLAAAGTSPARICLFTFATAGTACHAFPSGLFRGYPYQLQWSPDGSHIAFTEDPLQTGYDADIWLLTVADGSYTNLTDDGITGSWRDQQGGTPANVDYLPMWNTADGQIYFWRFVSQEAPAFTLGIFSIAPDGGTPSEVREVSSVLPAQLPIFDYERWFMDGPSALSPDGTTLAVLLSAINETGGSDQSLYLLDLQDTAAAPQQLMTNTDFQSALPSWAPFPASAMGLSWVEDGTAVVTVAPSLGSAQLPFVPFYYVPADGSGFEPVVNFSELPDQEAYFARRPKVSCLCARTRRGPGHSRRQAISC